MNLSQRNLLLPFYGDPKKCYWGANIKMRFAEWQWLTDERMQIFIDRIYWWFLFIVNVWWHTIQFIYNCTMLWKKILFIWIVAMSHCNTIALTNTMSLFTCICFLMVEKSGRACILHTERPLPRMGLQPIVTYLQWGTSINRCTNNAVGRVHHWGMKEGKLKSENLDWTHHCFLMSQRMVWLIQDQFLMYW